MIVTCQHLYRHLDTKRLEISKFNKDKQLQGTSYICIDRFYCQRCLDIKEVRKEEYVKTLGIIPEWARK